MIQEADVALTDFGLAVETGAFAVLLARRGAARPLLRAWWVLFFAAGCAATVLGGIVHAGWGPRVTPLSGALWAGGLVALGATALGAWGIGATLALRPAAARWMTRAAVVEFAAYALAVAVGARAFAVAVANYLPAALFLLGVFALAYRRTGGRHAGLGVLGVLTTFAASWVQWAQVALHPRWFTHNALYHAIEAVALLLLFLAARGLVTAPGEGPQ